MEKSKEKIYLKDAMLPFRLAEVSAEQAMLLSRAINGDIISPHQENRLDLAEILNHLYKGVSWFTEPFYRDTLRSSNIFWQYPARTEQDAYERHLNNNTLIKSDGNIISIYIPIPFATLIDKKNLAAHHPTLSALFRFCQGYQWLMENLGYKNIRVVSTCQHIYWDKIVSLATTAGINVLYCSHATQRTYIDRSRGKIAILPWVLYAPNIEEKERRLGLSSISIKKKKYLASFKGAYMKHYLNEDRIRLQDIRSANIFIEVNEEWHMQEVVYKKQLIGNHLDNQTVKLEEIRNYNELLSQSIFSICPQGAGLNTLRFWESIALGSIPILIGIEWLPPFLSSDNGSRITSVSVQDFCVVIDREQIRSLESIISNISWDVRKKMSDKAIEYYKLSKAILPL